MEQPEQRGEGSRSVQRATQRLQDKINNPFVKLLNSVGHMTYVRMPAWIQPVLDRGYEIATRYQFFVDFSIVFSLLFAMPITIFLIWSIGSLVITMILWAVAYVAVNGLSIGMSLLCISPVLVTSLLMTFCITLIITSIRLIIYGGLLVYKYTLTFLRNRDYTMASNIFEESPRLQSAHGIRIYEKREECPST